MEFAEYCSACLITGVKMFRSNIIDVKLLNYLPFPLNYSQELASICFECAALLRKFENFKSKCDRAQDVLSQLRQNSHEITLLDILKIDREQHKLVSTMTPKSLYCIASDLRIDTTDIKEENLVECEIIPVGIDTLEIKNEIKDVEDSPLHYYDEQIDDYDLNDSISKAENANSHSHKKRKSNVKREKKSKKRKVCTKDNTESTSDDEPLANKVSKTDDMEDNEITRTSRKNCILKYFEDYATVVLLSPEDAERELLLRKESNNYIKSPYKCSYCYRGFEADATFNNHMKKHNKENGEYECELCHLWFPEKRALCKHRLSSHKRKFSCKLCPYVCFCSTQAKTHISLHKGKTYPCNACSETFSHPNSLLMHKRVKHVAECVCSFCGNTFATPRGLYYHRMKLHRQEKFEKLGPKCEECGIQFASEEAWKLHLVLSPKHNVSNGCKNCGKTFPNFLELKNHMKEHARKQARRAALKLPTSCTLCGSYLGKSHEYKAHMRTVHPHSELTKQLEEHAPYVCETCGMAFKKQCFMRYHQRTHSDERPYACAQCEKRFKHASALYSHRAKHANKTHACRVCGRDFSYKSALNKHMKVHLNIRPHRCEVCDKSFINPCDVRLHIKYVHDKVPWPKRDRAKKTQHAQLTHY